VPAPKALPQHVRDATFRARRHHGLLVGPVVPWPELASLQAIYVASTSEPERRAVGVLFEHAMRDLESVRLDDDGSGELDRILALPPVPISIANDKRSVQRYWRAMQAAAVVDPGGSLRAAARELGVSPATVRRDLRWLDTFALPDWLRRVA